MIDMSSIAVTLDDIRATAARVAPFVLRTPMVRLGFDGPWLKAETLQASGAFKLRGAFAVMTGLSEAERRRGVVAHSSGNHAMAVAYAAKALGVPATIVMPSDAPRAKIDAVERLQARLELVGPASDERAQRADRIVEEQGLVPVPPYDDLRIITATAGIALEIIEQQPDLDVVYAPVSGGGLIAGLALGFHLAGSPTRVIGVEPEVAADGLASLKAGRLVSLSGEQMARTAADGLRVQQLGALNWQVVQALLAEIVTVSEAEIRATMATIAMQSRLVAEPSGAVAPAAALRIGGGARTAAILSGGNLDAEVLRSALAAAT